MTSERLVVGENQKNVLSKKMSPCKYYLSTFAVMKKLNHLSLNLLLLAVVVAIGSSCKKKENKCNEQLAIEGPTYVNEGDNFTLTPINATDINGVNTYFYWKYADMSNATQTVSGMYEVFDASPVTFEKADIRHEGLYMFKIHNSDDNCIDALASHTVKIIPKVSPCFNSLSVDTMLIDESFTAGTIEQPYVPVLTLNSFGDEFSVELVMPMFTYFLEFSFDIPIPNYSSTYTLRNTYQNYADSQIPDDPIIQAYVEFSPDNEGADAYRIAENQENIYVKVEDNVMYLSYCDLLFTHTSIPGRTIKLSGKVKINL